jgi:uncharacterized SAM-binding protein YcdF (DUF218 family)
MRPLPLIPKEPIVPDLTPEQIAELTEIVFLKAEEPVPCDAIFVFGGTHPGHWEATIEAYNRGLGRTIMVTGGVSPTAVRHAAWEDDRTPESHVIVARLLAAGIPESAILFEDRSCNTLHNVLVAKEQFDFSTMNSLLFVCKSHGAGRQYRTMAKHLPSRLRYIPYGFDTGYGTELITRMNWMDSIKGRSRVYGEYLRILFYGERGDILALEKPITGLEEDAPPASNQGNDGQEGSE